MGANRTHSLSDLYWPRIIHGAENSPVIAMCGELENAAQITFVGAGQAKFKKTASAIIPGYVTEEHYKLRVSRNGSQAVLFPPGYRSGEILTCSNNATIDKVDVSANESRGIIISAQFFGKETNGSSLLALYLGDRVQICGIGQHGLEVQREVRWSLDEDTGDDITISGLGDLCCVPDLGGVMVYQIAGKTAKLIQTIEYIVSCSVLHLQLEKFGDVCYLFLSEMGGPLRVFRYEDCRFTQAWEYKVDGGHILEARKKLLGTRGEADDEQISLIVCKLSPAQSMSHHILDVSGKRVGATEMTSDGCPPVTGLFNNGNNLFYSHMNERTKKGGILIAEV